MSPARRRGSAAALGISGVCFAAAALLRFALRGYETLGLCAAVAGLAVLLYGFLPRRGRQILTVALCLGGALFLSGEIPVLLAADGDVGTEADYVIVLGAAVHGSEPSLALLDRLRAAKAYLEAHPDCVAVVSGGQGPGESLSEAEAMYRWLTAQGIGPERVIRETRAASTMENLEYSFALLPEAARTGGGVAVLSSEYHLCRAKYLAARMGCSVAGIPARTSLPVLKLNYFIREGLGMVYYRLGLG